MRHTPPRVFVKASAIHVSRPIDTIRDANAFEYAPQRITLNDKSLVLYAALDDSVGCAQGHNSLFVDREPIGKVPCLAICQNAENQEVFTPYFCDQDGKLLAVVEYKSNDAAKRKAETIDPGSSALRRQPPTGFSAQSSFTPA